MLRRAVLHPPVLHDIPVGNASGNSTVADMLHVARRGELELGTRARREGPGARLYTDSMTFNVHKQPFITVL